MSILLVVVVLHENIDVCIQGEVGNVAYIMFIYMLKLILHI